MTASRDPAALLAIMAQEHDESARGLEAAASRQDARGAIGAMAAQNMRRDAAEFRDKANACRTGAAAIAVVRQPEPQMTA